MRGLGREKERWGAGVFRWAGWSLITNGGTKGNAEGSQNERKNKPGSDCTVSDRLELCSPSLSLRKEPEVPE